MTFKGAALQNLKELELLIAVIEGNIRAYTIHLKYCSIRRDKTEMEECAITLNCYEKELDELNKLKSEIIRKINVMCKLMNDLEGRVFVMKLQMGKTNKEICTELSISEPYLYKIIDSIDNILKNTKDGQDILTSLTE